MTLPFLYRSMIKPTLILGSAYWILFLPLFNYLIERVLRPFDLFALTVRWNRTYHLFIISEDSRFFSRSFSLSPRDIDPSILHFFSRQRNHSSACFSLLSLFTARFNIVVAIIKCKKRCHWQGNRSWIRSSYFRVMNNNRDLMPFGMPNSIDILISSSSINIAFLSLARSLSLSLSLLPLFARHFLFGYF